MNETITFLIERTPEHHDEVTEIVVVQFDGSTDIATFACRVREFALALGYHADSVDEAFPQPADDNPFVGLTRN